jgi:hypothetical protein
MRLLMTGAIDRIIRARRFQKGISGACDENAGATGLAPDAVVFGSRRTVAFVDPQLAIEKMQLFDARMSMRRVTGAGRQPYQHADPVPFRVGRQQLAFDPWRNLFPFRLRPLQHRQRHRLFPRLLGDPKGKTLLQWYRRTQHIGGPADQPIDDWPQVLQLALAIRARGNTTWVVKR